jgi:hypothetical protein
VNTLVLDPRFACDGLNGYVKLFCKTLIENFTVIFHENRKPFVFVSGLYPSVNEKNNHHFF